MDSSNIKTFAKYVAIGAGLSLVGFALAALPHVIEAAAERVFGGSGRKGSSSDSGSEESSSRGYAYAGPSRQKGESYDQFSSRRHDTRVDSWVDEKQRSGDWLPKDEYERQTGRSGRS